MQTVAGIFRARDDAERAAADLRGLGLADERISLLAPGTTDAELEKQVPTTETEQPGMGGAIGGTVGGAMGAASGVTLGMAAASALVPGVGPVIAAGMIGAALLGIGGAAAGAAAGNALEENITAGLPHDELFVYEDALRRGHAVVIAVADDDDQAARAREILERAGAESIDAARERWWIGLRDAEEESYRETGREFRADEPTYRKGFEAALHPRARGLSFADASEQLRARHGELCDDEAFRRGYERCQAYQQSLREKYRS